MISRWLGLAGDIVTILLLFLLLAACEPEPTVYRIAFGSCANQSAPQPIWNAIIDFNPQIFIWLGDNIYGDIKRPMKVFGKERTIGPWKNVARFVPSSEHEMQAKYDKAKNNHGYSHLQQNVKVIGTWDDHDYGLNDAGKEFGGKMASQRLMLDFLDEPRDSPRRKQAGVYASYTFGPVGRQVKVLDSIVVSYVDVFDLPLENLFLFHVLNQEALFVLIVILLDTRYHRDPLFSDGSMLGNSQWSWLEKELNGPASAITIIGSSVQVISNLSAVTGPLFYMESWGLFPAERARLFNLIANSKRDGVLFISGDVHFGEITQCDCITGYPLYDITSSGLTQAVEKTVPPPLHLLLRFLAWLTPSTMRVKNKSCRYRSCTYGQPNFGAIEINWDATPVSLKFEVRDADGLMVMSVNRTLLELQSKSSDSKGGKEWKYCSLEVNLPWIVRYRLLVFFFCAFSVLFLALIGLIYAVASLCMKYLLKCKLD